MVYTDVQICNIGLTKLGAENISALTDDEKVAILCNRHFLFCVAEVLEMFAFCRATKRASLARLGVAPVSGYDYQYQLPNDCLYVLEMTSSTNPYRIEADKLLTDDLTCYIRYIYQDVVLNALGPLLVDAIATRLASMIAMAVTNSRLIKRDIDQEFAGIMQQAKFKDARERKEDDVGTDSWVDAQDNA